MTLTKTDIVREVSMRHDDITKAQASNAMESFMNLAKAVKISGDGLFLSGFGKFIVRSNKEREGRNPQTESELMLRSRRVATFSPSGILRAKVNDQ